MCCMKKAYMDVLSYDIQGKISLTQEWLDFFKRYSTAELSYIKKDSYQYDHSWHVANESILPILENKGSQKYTYEKEHTDNVA